MGAIKIRRYSTQEMFEIFQTHNLAFEGKDFLGFRFLQSDGRILELYINEELKVTILLQEEDKILKINRVLDMKEFDMILDYYRVVPIRPRKEITLDFDWKQLLQVFKDRKIVTPRTLLEYLKRRTSQYIQ